MNIFSSAISIQVQTTEFIETCCTITVSL